MSFAPTQFRPLARGGWGGNAGSDWRGALAISHSLLGITEYDPQVLVGVYYGQIGSVLFEGIGGHVNQAIIGVTRDSAGVAVGSCRIELFQTGGDTPTQTLTSDASGNYRFDNPGSGPFYIVAYKANAPDIAGTTANTLIAIGV